MSYLQNRNAQHDIEHKGQSQRSMTNASCKMQILTIWMIVMTYAVSNGAQAAT